MSRKTTMDQSRSPLAALRRAWSARAEPADPALLFPQRLRHPRMARSLLPLEPLIEADAQQAFEAAVDAEGAGERVLYLHIPFCAQARCAFCGYAREELESPDRAREYVEALSRRLSCWAETRWAQARPFTAIYLGGGTPTTLPTAELCRLLTRLEELLPLSPTVEISIESCPSSLPDDRALGWLAEAGVNRLSLGVQSFDDALRQRLGRKSARAELLSQLSRASAAVPSLAVDLLYGLPGQTREGWRADLQTVVESEAIGQCSVYPLVLFGGAPLARAAADGEVELPCPPQLEYDLFASADELLGGAGLSPWTPVHYGRMGTARYLEANARGAEVLACGASSAGRVGPLAYMQAWNVSEFIGAEPAFNGLRVFRWPGGRQPEALRWLQLSEASGVDLRALEGMLPAMDEVLPMLTELQLIEQRGARLELTRDGRYWAGNLSALICELIAAELAMTGE
jgi:coproporphyrinogen III oxidase-like Fe-S oxidoreductase